MIDLIFFKKLLKENVSSKYVNAMRNMCATIKSCVRINNELSHFIKSNIGVKQGDPSSSLLFLFERYTFKYEK